MKLKFLGIFVASIAVLGGLLMLDINHSSIANAKKYEEEIVVAQQTETSGMPERKAYAITKDKKKKHTKQTLGYIEKVLVGESSIMMKAKLDTGATTSSINADIIKVVTDEEENREYVIFRIDEDKEAETFKSEIVRWVRIKGKQGKLIRRPVILMEFCFGYTKVKEEVNLSERDHFLYPVLIGRNMLAGNVIVDPDRKFTIQPKCNKKNKNKNI
jgi:hypothetical protein